MNYKIVELNEFKVMGIKYELSTSLIRNIKLAQKHWMNFNNKLKHNNIYLGNNWCKYAFIIGDDSKLFYFISVPKKDYVPDDFIIKTIPNSKYLMINHRGNMNRLKRTMDSIYTKIKEDNTILNDNDFYYFEKYDYKFHWNRSDSIIEIYLPIK